MKRILLLGAFGFIGTNLFKYIITNQLPFKVIAFDRFNQHPLGIDFTCAEKVYFGDFSDESLISSIFEDQQIDLVVHCISSTIPTGLHNARYDVESNLLPTIKLLDVMVQHGCNDIVFLSSGGAVYGIDALKHSENSIVFPISSYGVVKLAIEKYLFQYAYHFHLRPLVLRLSNPYGRYHRSIKQGIVNVALRAARRGDSFVVWGDGKATKDYIFVEDVCKVIFDLINRNVYNQIINVGSGHVYSVNEILRIIKGHYPKFEWSYDRANANDVMVSELNLDKLHQYVEMDFSRIEDVILNLEK